MPRPLRKKFPGATYHVTLRGNGRATIFHCSDDYVRFREQLEHAVVMDGVVLYAWACMPNHAHLLVMTPWGNVDKFMHRLETAYGMYYRYKHHRPGHCLQGRYGAKLVQGDLYLLRLTRYIHLNPVKVDRMKSWSDQRKLEYLHQYKWSSYLGYIDKEFTEEIVDYRWMDLMDRRTERGTRRAYRRYVEAFLTQDDELILAAMKASRWAIGDQEFVESIDREMTSRRRELSHPSDVAGVPGRAVPLSTIMETVAQDFRVSSERIRARGCGAGHARAVMIELACRHCGMTQRALAEELGVSEHAVGKQRRRLLDRVKGDPVLASRLGALSDVFSGEMSSV